MAVARPSRRGEARGDGAGVPVGVGEAIGMAVNLLAYLFGVVVYFIVEFVCHKLIVEYFLAISPQLQSRSHPPVPMQYILNPRSIAIVGASSDPRSLGE